MSRFFKPYEGKRPYLFISYAHHDSGTVVDTIRILDQRAVRLWYDEGIPAGSDWPSNIAGHMRDCEAVVFFQSEQSLRSPNCFSEIKTAARSGKPILVFLLDDSEPKGEWAAILEGRQRIRCLASPEENADALRSSPFLTKRYLRRWNEKLPRGVLGLTASLVFFLAAAAVFGALLSGRWAITPDAGPLSETAVPNETAAAPVVVDLGASERFFAVSFPDKQQEKAIRQAVGNSDGEVLRGDLANVDALYFCGNMVLQNTDGTAFRADGSCLVNGAPVVTGKVGDLSLFPYMTRLKALALIEQPLQSLEALSGHVLLRELSLAGCDITSVSSLQDLPSLEILHLEHSAVRDLSGLEKLPALKTVTVSQEMLPLSWSRSARFEVVLARDQKR